MVSRLITQARLVDDGQLYSLEIDNGIIAAQSPPKSVTVFPEKSGVWGWRFRI